MSPRWTPRVLLALCLTPVGCVAVMNISEDDLETIEDGACEHYHRVCDDTGDFRDDLVWLGSTCEEAIAEATADGATTTALELDQCMQLDDCLELLDCFQEKTVFRYIDQPACKPTGAACLEACVPADCNAPHRCCSSPCSNGICE